MPEKNICYGNEFTIHDHALNDNVIYIGVALLLAILKS